MKNLKKVLAVALALVMTFALAACGGKEDANTQKDDGALKTVKEGTLVMATSADFPPYEFMEGNEYKGIDVEIAGLVAEKLGLKLEIANVAFDSIVPGVQQGKYDIGMAGMTVTEERIEKVNFSSSYAKGVQVVLVPENSPIKTLDDLKDKKIGVQQGTTGDIYASDDFGKDAVVKYEIYGTAIQALKTNKVDCVILDNGPAKEFIKANEGLKMLDTAYAEEDYAIALSKENDALKQAINDALVELTADGSLKKVVDKYVKAD